MLRLGIVGCGRVTTMFHLKAINEVDDVSVQAVTDVNNDRVRGVMGSCASAKAYASIMELLGDPDVDAVVINTPPLFHEEMVIESLNYGKHVLCEKPLAQTVEGCLRIRDALKNIDLIVLPGHNYLYTPSLEKMAELLTQGAIGDLKHIRVYFENNLRIYGSRTDFRIRSENGLVEDVLPHVLSVSSLFAGRIKEVRDLAWWCKQYRVCDNIKATLETITGIKIDFSLSWTRLVPRFKVALEGTDGRIETDLMVGPYTVTVDRDGRVETIKERGVDWYLDLVQFKHPSFQRQYKHFARLVSGIDKPVITVDDETSMLGVIKKVNELMAEVPMSG